MAHSDTSRPITDLLGGLVTDISGLFRKEIELAKAEASEKVEEAAKAGRNLAIGGVLVNMGMGEAAANVVAALLVTAVIGGVAWAMISRGLAELKANKLNMQRTAHSIRMDADTVRESF